MSIHPTKAGLIPYFVTPEGQIEMLFMVSSNPAFGGPDPMISKGNIDPGETAYGCAIREAEEELGLRSSNLLASIVLASQIELAGLYDSYIMQVYVGQIKCKQAFNEPHYETKHTVWMTADQFNEVGRSTHRDIVQKTLAVIQRTKQ